MKIKEGQSVIVYGMKFMAVKNHAKSCESCSFRYDKKTCEKYSCPNRSIYFIPARINKLSINDYFEYNGSIYKINSINIKNNNLVVEFEDIQNAD